MRVRPFLAVLATMATTSVARADCDLPQLRPTIVAPGGGTTPRIVTGVVGICDPAARTFEIDLPAMPKVENAAVQLSFAGFDRRYGVHQIGFVLQSETATPTAKGIVVTFGATVDGLDRYQLAYTLYLDLAR